MSALASDGRAHILGIYSHPAAAGGHVLFDLDLGYQRVVPSMFERAPTFVLEALLTSSITCSFFTEVPAYTGFVIPSGPCASSATIWGSRSPSACPAAPSRFSKRMMYIRRPRSQLCYHHSLLSHCCLYRLLLRQVLMTWGSLRQTWGLALGSRRWFRQLDQSTATEFVLTLPWKKGRSSSSYSKYLRPHAKSLAGVPAIEIAGRAKADFCFDFAQVVLCLLVSSSTTRIRMRDTRAQMYSPVVDG